jgi:phage protein D
MSSNNGSRGLVQATRPVITVGGRDDAALSANLVSLVIAEDTQGLYRCEAGIGNWGNKGNGLDFLYFDRKTLDFGKPIQVKIGGDVFFDGRIMALEGQFLRDVSPQLTVLAEDRFQDLRMTRRTRSFADTDDSGVFNRVASEHGLTAQVKVQGPTHRLLAQVNLSDLAFLRERARAIDAEVWVSGTTLFAQSHTNRGGTPYQIRYKQALREFSVLADLANQRTSVTVGGWDVARKTAIAHQADDSVLAGELNGDASGSSVLAQALGTRAETLAHTAPLTDQEAQAQAESYFKMAARRFVVGRGLADTDIRLRAGNFVTIQGLGPLFSGKYYLTVVNHLYDGIEGLRTEFTAEKPGLGKT